MPTIHLLIKGRVQGVCYRASAKEQARHLALTGWVKNTPEGHVEITASGDPDSLEKFVTWCRRGPSQAFVTAMERHSLPDTAFEDFQVLRE
jgi:acylphosphatase